MRRARDIRPLVKAANLARWFPPWTVTREQWSSMSRPAVSGIAIETLLFSRIGVPLFHRYRVVNRSGTHGAFRGAYMRRMHAVRPHRSEVNTMQALMDLAFPRFEGLGDRPRQVHRPWMVSTESPDPGCLTELLRSPSPCLNLETLSSDDTEGSVGLSNLSVTLLCGSGEDLPPVVGSEDSRQVIRIRDISPDVQTVDISQVGWAWDSRRTVSKGGSGKQMPLSVCVPATATSDRSMDDALGLSASDPSPVVGAVDLPGVGRVETIQLSSPPMSGQLSPGSPRMVAFEDLADSSVPLSTNHVQAGRSQEVPEDGSLFNVSPVSPGFLMRPSGAAGQHPEAGLPLPWRVLVTRFLVTQLPLLNVHRFRGRIPL